MHDSHIHLCMEPLKSNIDDVINNFIAAGGKYILTQGTDMLDFHDTLDISKRYFNVVQCALGLHPTFFQETTIHKNIYKNIYDKSIKNIEKYIDIVEKNINDITAIGETGLDYYQINMDKQLDREIVEEIEEIQRVSFKKHIKLAQKHDLALSIHARDINEEQRCIQDVLEIVAQEGKGLIKGCFHSYTGNISYMDDILNLGFCIGFNAIITYKSGSDVRQILKRTPLERILFETDGPFLPPQSLRKNKKIKEKYAQPMHVREIMEVAAEVKEVDIEKLEKITDENYERVFLKEK
ncbi:MAG: TatD family hydrolase [Candidatus Dojkabacteria bacterium]|jgi:TatD DNase family protein